MGRRVIYTKYGDPEVLRVEAQGRPRPGPGEVLIDVAFAGVNYADVIARRGFYKWAPPFPTCVGFELSGVVAALGEGVTSHRLGDRVVAVTRFGGYADAVVVEAQRAWPLPEELTLAEGAAIPAVTITAWHALVNVLRVRSGESLLIQAVAGGVGLAALQIAKHFGVFTYGTASSPEKLAFARARGLDHGIDYTRVDFEHEIGRLTQGQGIDHVLDSLGGEALRKGYRALKPGGHAVTIGAAQVAPAERTPWQVLKAGAELVRGGVFHPFQLIEDNKSIAGVQVLLLWNDVPLMQAAMREILQLARASVIKPHVDRIVPLERAAEAHVLLESRKTRGKLLLACAGA
ncbi:MAG: zinc-binding dehydrogenase [Myxococcales bacterium]